MTPLHYLVSVLQFADTKDTQSCKCIKQCWNSKSRHQELAHNISQTTVLN